MTPYQRQAIVLSLLQSREQHDSWCGETHIQKTAYVLETMFHVPLNLGFILYKHGPYSFTLREILAELKSTFLVGVEAKDPYGSKFTVSTSGERFLEQFPETVAKYGDRLNTAAKLFSAKGVVQLEQLATALYVQKTEPQLSDAESQARRLNELKPHVSIQDALKAVQEINQFRHVAVPAG